MAVDFLEDNGSQSRPPSSRLHPASRRSSSVSESPTPTRSRRESLFGLAEPDMEAGQQVMESLLSTEVQGDSIPGESTAEQVLRSVLGVPFADSTTMQLLRERAALEASALYRLAGIGAAPLNGRDALGRPLRGVFAQAGAAYVPLGTPDLNLARSVGASIRVQTRKRHRRIDS
eukprot:CAMPEP_0184363502 /NCGR_PEP_ID=MMETSP1089-20130417/140026_1 /TAXON_ID=38269 ORGANISM="Gloeochaete wittrockiana, Strain SAG46.84" /NCGR_SAMPLE_ID=MMETSP1089 /ASSEMBLY_ACC=CAM_ASM_000445 /LENGTH=173 /DNA_ID=CAMNT_0026704023 /DNA_START=30 /DNA_END=548 /DNA_ORIENTATION=-